MPEWLWSILIGGVVMSLMGVIYRGMLTKHEHANLCKEAHEEFKKIVQGEIQSLKDYFDLKIENVILKEIRKINGNHK